MAWWPIQHFDWYKFTEVWSRGATTTVDLVHEICCIRGHSEPTMCTTSLRDLRNVAWWLVNRSGQTVILQCWFIGICKFNTLQQMFGSCWQPKNLARYIIYTVNAGESIDISWDSDYLQLLVTTHLPALNSIIYTHLQIYQAGSESPMARW